jgi:hypothetical protein
MIGRLYTQRKTVLFSLFTFSFFLSSFHQQVTFL